MFNPLQMVDISAMNKAVSWMGGGSGGNKCTDKTSMLKSFRPNPKASLLRVYIYIYIIYINPVPTTLSYSFCFVSFEYIHELV